MPSMGKVRIALLATSGCVGLGIYLFRKLIEIIEEEERIENESPFRLLVDECEHEGNTRYQATVSVNNFNILDLTANLGPTGQFFVTIDSNCGVRWSRSTAFERVGRTSPIPGNSDDEPEEYEEGEDEENQNGEAQNGENQNHNESGPANHMIQEFQNGIFQIRSSQVRGHIVTPRRPRANRFLPQIGSSQ